MSSVYTKLDEVIEQQMNQDAGETEQTKGVRGTSVWRTPFSGAIVDYVQFGK